MISELPALAANGGTVLLFAGMPEGARVSVDAFAVHYREVSSTGSFHYTPRDVDAAFALLVEGAIPVSSLVEERRVARPVARGVRPRRKRSRDEGGSRPVKAVLVRSLDDVAVVEMEKPVPGPGEIVVAMKAVGICGSDTTPWYVVSKAPVVLGHEPSGVVAETGALVRAFRAGDRVVVHHHAACGACRFCRAGEDVMCPEWKKTRLHPGGLAEYVRVEAAAVATDTLRLPDAVSFEDGALVEPLACAVKAVRRARIAAGDSVAVIGLGANGILLGLVAKSAGAATLVGCDPDPARRAHALRLGFDQVLAPEEDLSEKVKRGDRAGADVIFVLPTAESAVASALAAAGPAGTGRLLFANSARQDVDDRAAPAYTCATFRCSSPTLAVRGISGRRSRCSSAARSVPRDLVTHRVPFARAAEAFALARQGGDVLKVVVTF